MRVVTCTGCHDSIAYDMRYLWHKVDAVERGGRASYLCPDCARRLESYDADNDAAPRGTATTSGITYGFEFEVHAPTLTLRRHFMRYELMPSHDCTTDCEFKSPVYLSLNPIKGFARTIEKMLANGEGRVTSEDGTHFHTGHALINYYTRNYIVSNYYALFGPLCDAMRSDPDACARLFGRSLGYWADAITPETWAFEHTNFINIQHEHTFEWRICKFKTAAQYLAAAQFCKAATACVINNFIAYVERGYDAATLKHKADVTGRKLARLFQKYAAAAPVW